MASHLNWVELKPVQVMRLLPHWPREQLRSYDQLLAMARADRLTSVGNARQILLSLSKIQAIGIVTYDYRVQRAAPSSVGMLRNIETNDDLALGHPQLVFPGRLTR